MEADWEVEIGGGAPVIEAEWAGLVDLRSHPECIAEVAEAAAFPALAALLLALNAAHSPLWTSKCDVWEPEPAALACYIDMLPVEGRVFARWQQAEAFCREYVTRLAQITRPELRATGYGIMNLVSISCGGFADWGFGILRDRHVPLGVIFGVFAGVALLSVLLVLCIRPREPKA